MDALLPLLYVKTFLTVHQTKVSITDGCHLIHVTPSISEDDTGAIIIKDRQDVC